MRFLDRLLGPPTLESLVRAATRSLKQRGADRIEFDAARQELAIQRGGASSRLYLGNLLAEYQKAPRRERPAVLERFLGALFNEEALAAPASYEAVKDRLMPVVRGRAGMAINRMTVERTAEPGRSQMPVFRPLAADIVVALVTDMPDAMAYVNQESLDRWGVSFEQALEDAMLNLRGLPEHGGWTQLAPGVWSGEWGDAYESSRLLLPDLIYRLNVPRPVAMVPFRNALIVASANDGEAVARMVEAARSALGDNGRWVSFELLQLEGNRWVEHEAGDESRDALRWLRLHSTADTYGTQKQLLDAEFAEREVDIFVASVQLLSKGGQDLTSYVVWSDGVDTLLPEGEHVVFTREVDGEMRHAMVPWPLVRARFANLMEATDHEPVRYRVRSIPAWSDIEPLALA